MSQFSSIATPIASGDWLDRFQPFSWTHGAVLLTFAIVATMLILLGRRLRGTPGQQRFERWLGVAVLVIWAIISAWRLRPDVFDVRFDLPLHLCDLTAPVAGLALATRSRFARALLYFWGFGLNTQAFITPLLQSGPAHANFWLFWGLHFVIVGSAIYDLVVGAFRPTWRDFGLAALGAALYVLIVLPIDIAHGLNYGFIGPSLPSQTTVLDALGPWPLRVVWIVLLSLSVMALLKLPWLFIPARGVVQRRTKRC